LTKLSFDRVSLRAFIGARHRRLLLTRTALRGHAQAFACGLELVVGAARAIATVRELLVSLRECGVARAERGLERGDLGLAEGCGARGGKMAQRVGAEIGAIPEGET
jgi:hypothetical protein